jgi:hypothetical protein
MKCQAFPDCFQIVYIEVPHQQGGAFRQGNRLFLIAPLIPAYKAGLTGCAPGHDASFSSIPRSYIFKFMLT